ncbi:Na+/H+ antiporter subunit E [Desulfobacter latus]|uniref:Na+/H+ antiporter subunit E n=2 Tax=Desulfobacter latus TaxID=2292 RepID=A0A850T8B4_9BACT|nr:Na+/H+ antiporter subunit E [Desulfobacter latus]
MFLTWVVLSGNFSTLLISLGVISSLLVAWFFHDLLFPNVTSRYPGLFFGFIAYIPWLMWQIVKANFNLMFLIFHPRMNELIDPHITVFQTHLTSDLSITILANSITLTPGTITVTATADGLFSVHAIDRRSADALPGTMLAKVAGIYGEKQ